ncbi:S1 family peptidase [Hyalangium versicolor]|uniref:S1 family peptidase n=1 Tax=Hyalangium versicolor TaxID=2861190 RepID=UPI001CCE9CB3|nr:S1 family peptidase [Hyalangium versicolor]
MCARDTNLARLLVIVLWLLESGCASTPDSYFAVAKGENDHANRYQSTVLVTTPLGDCSGVLIAPRLVLFSAHCACLPADFGTRAGKWLYTSEKCEQNATVKVYRYQQVNGKWARSPEFYEGTVVAHEDFRSEIQDGKVKSHRADLAVIQLETAALGINPDGNMPEVEVKPNESLVVVGFGPSVERGDNGGVRRSGRNTVTEVITTRETKEFRFTAGGIHILSGDSGGPCFRETDEGRWLVGINGGFTKAKGGYESWFTSTFYYRSWIERQKRDPKVN